VFSVLICHKLTAVIFIVYHQVIVFIQFLLSAPTDIDLTRGTTRLHAVDLIPPPETPLIGRHDSNWESFLKHIPAQMRGVAPPQLNVCFSVLLEFSG
jgi:hypothetical protein